MLLEAGVADLEHLGAPMQEPRERERAFALWRISRSSSVASDRCSSQVSNGPAMAPPCARCSRNAAAHAGSRTLTEPRIRSE